MNEQKWITNEYETWDEAFRGLLPVIRQQSVRVASYTQVLFVQACASSYEKNNPAWESMQGQDPDLAYKCGLYHQLGKSLLKPELQLWLNGFSDEEEAIYRSYTKNGRLLVASLQEISSKSKDKSSLKTKERSTNKIPWLMVRETCEQHMERWNGSGYPDGRVGDEISPIAQIVGLAKELDRLVSETKSENPFDDAYVTLLKQEGKEYSPELIKVLLDAKGQCRGVYRKYIQYTKTIPKTIPLVEKRKERPMGLTYRQVGETTYEAIPWFKVIDKSDQVDSLDHLEPMMVRTNILKEIMLYLLYETTDTLLRMKHCEFEQDILLGLPAGFFKGNSKLGEFNHLFEDQPINMSKLLLGVPEEAVILAEKSERENIVDYIESGIQLVLDGYNPEELSLQQVQEIGFSKVRIADELEDEFKAEIETMLQERGIQCIGYGQEGTEVEEEALIQGLLLGER